MSKTLNHETYWIEKLRAGEDVALTYFFDLYKSKLFLFCFRFVKSKDLADEIVQETFVRLWQTRDRLTDKSSCGPLLFRIAQNQVMDFMRQAAREKKYQAAVAAKMKHAHNHAEEKVIYGEILEKIATQVNTLPSQRQLIFRMSREEGLTHEEISQRLGISTNTVKVSIFKSLKSIRNNLSLPSDIFLIAVVWWMC